MVDRHELRWRSLLFYGLTSLLVVAVGVLVIYTFFEKRSLTARIVPEPLPKVAVVTSDPSSPLAAAWVNRLDKAELKPVLVPIEKMESTDAILAFCDVKTIPPGVQQYVEGVLAEGGGVVILGDAPQAERPFAGLTTTRGMSDRAIRFAEAATPVLARVQPGRELGCTSSEVAFAEETPRMVVDARWKDNARAAVAHYRLSPGRVLWIGFDPSKLYVPDDAHLTLMLRTAFRWVAGQPVSEGAIGTPTAARTLTPAARLTARAKRMTFSVDRLRNSPDWYTIRVRNNTAERLLSPTIKFWLPPNTAAVELGGSLVARRYVTLIGDPEENAVLISLLALGPHEDRMIKLRAIKREAVGSQ